MSSFIPSLVCLLSCLLYAVLFLFAHIFTDSATSLFLCLLAHLKPYPGVGFSLLAWFTVIHIHPLALPLTCTPVFPLQLCLQTSPNIFEKQDSSLKFLSKNFGSEKKFQQKFWVKKKFGLKKILDPKKFWYKKDFWSKKSVGSEKKFWSEKIWEDLISRHVSLSWTSPLMDSHGRM